MLAAFDLRRPTRDIDLQAHDLANDAQTVRRLVHRWRRLTGQAGDTTQKEPAVSLAGPGGLTSRTWPEFRPPRGRVEWPVTHRRGRSTACWRWRRCRSSGRPACQVSWTLPDGPGDLTVESIALGDGWYAWSDVR